MATQIKSEMAANVWKVLVRKGETVEAGAAIAILESMKMEIPVETEIAGTVMAVEVVEGDGIDEGAVIAVLE